MTDNHSRALFADEFQSIISSSMDGFLLVDLSGNILETNESFIQFIGYSREELLNRHLSTIDTFDSPADVTVRFENIMKKGSLRFETRLQGKDGHLFDVEVSANYSIAHGGSIVSFIRDVTEKKAAESALIESETRFRTIMEEIPKIAVQGYKLDGQVFFWNHASEELYGYSQEEAIGKNLLDLIIPEAMKDAVTDAINQMKKSGESILPGELLLKRKDGSSVPVFSSHALIKPVGREPEFFCLDIDLSDLKNAEKEAKTVRELFELFMKYTPVYTFIKRIEGDQSRVIQISDNYMEMIGRPASELRGCTMEEMFAADFARKVTEDDIALVNSGKVVQIDEELHGRFYTTIKFPIIKEGENSLLAGFTIDMTDRKLAQIERDAFEKQLQQSQKLESLGVLAGGIAHDFNNILAVIIGHCSLAEMNYEKAGDHIPTIEKAATRAAELCRQMLAYAGKAQNVQTQVNIKVIVEDTVAMLRATLSKNALISFNAQDDIPCIQADASQITQVALNLITNAAESLGNRPGEVRVSLTKSLIKEEGQEKDYLGKVITPGCYLCLDVSDTGCGMSDETYNRIFEPFYTTKFTGRGLGLSAVLGIITSNKGALQLFSQLGHGTTFKIFFPLPNLKCAVTESQSLKDPAVPWQGEGSILLVEDEDLVRNVANAMLVELGFSVIEAVNGYEALLIYQQNSREIRMVMTDIGMPVMDGYTLIRELIKINPALPIIISSGYGDTDVSTTLADLKIAGIVSKPYSFGQIRGVLKNIVANHPL